MTTRLHNFPTMTASHVKQWQSYWGSKHATLGAGTVVNVSQKLGLQVDSQTTVALHSILQCDMWWTLPQGGLCRAHAAESQGQTHQCFNNKPCMGGAEGQRSSHNTWTLILEEEGGKLVHFCAHVPYRYPFPKWQGITSTEVKMLFYKASADRCPRKQKTRHGNGPLQRINGHTILNPIAFPWALRKRPTDSWI